MIKKLKNRSNKENMAHVLPVFESEYQQSKNHPFSLDIIYSKPKITPTLRKQL